MCLIIPYYYKTFEDEINFFMKNKGAFMEAVLLNEVVKYFLFKPNFSIDFLKFILDFSISLLFSKHNFP